MESVSGPHLRTRAGGARQPWMAILLGTMPTRTSIKPGPAVMGGGDPCGSTATTPGTATRRGALQGHSGAHKKLWPSTAPSPLSGRLDSVLPPEPEVVGRESEVDDLRNSSSL